MECPSERHHHPAIRRPRQGTECLHPGIGLPQVADLFPFLIHTFRRLNQFDHDSPMAGVLPSPSTSSMNSLSSPAPLKLMSLSTLDWPTGGSSSDVPLTPLTPMTMMSNEKLFEGWARRRKTGQELSEATNKWPKCWMILRGPYLSCYTNQYVSFFLLFQYKFGNFRASIRILLSM